MSTQLPVQAIFLDAYAGSCIGISPLLAAIGDSCAASYAGISVLLPVIPDIFEFC
jgi:hypothetical protein